MTTTGLPNWPWCGAEADALPTAERLLIDAARGWAAALRQGQSPILAMRRLLATEDADAATEPLQALLRTLAQYPLRLGCPLCPNLVGEEPAVLLVVACAQRGPRREALACLMRYLSPQQAFVATAAAIQLGCTLRRAGLRMVDPWVA